MVTAEWNNCNEAIQPQSEGRIWEMCCLRFCAYIMFIMATFAHENNPTHDGSTSDGNRSCYDSEIDFHLMDKNYDSKYWPFYERIEECLQHLDPNDEAAKYVPHPCAYEIAVGLKLIDLKDINVAENLIFMEIAYMEEWIDKRIWLPTVMNPMCTSAENLRSVLYLEPIQYYRARIWSPDFYIRGCLGSRISKVIKSSEALVLHQNKRIENIITLHMVLMCPMDFQYYPFDEQTCNFTIESYGIFHKRIAIVWSQSGVELLPAFSLEGYEVDVVQQNPSVIKYGGYVFPQLKATLNFRRTRTKYILLIYVPSMLHFVIAWLAFFLPKEVSQGRCIINCSTTLSLVSMLSVYTRNSPHGGYVKVMDIWCYFSILFQFVCTLDAMIDTRLLYMAGNVKRNPLEGGTRRIWQLVTDTSHWLGNEVRLVRSRDEGRGFDDTARDIRRLTHVSDTRKVATGQRSAGAGGAETLRHSYRASLRYYRFLRLLVAYQEWSQYICLAWYLVFLLGYYVLCVP